MFAYLIPPLRAAEVRMDDFPPKLLDKYIWWWMAQPQLVLVSLTMDLTLTWLWFRYLFVDMAWQASYPSSTSRLIPKTLLSLFLLLYIQYALALTNSRQNFLLLWGVKCACGPRRLCFDCLFHGQKQSGWVGWQGSHVVLCRSLQCFVVIVQFGLFRDDQTWQGHTECVMSFFLFVPLGCYGYVGRKGRRTWVRTSGSHLHQRKGYRMGWVQRYFGTLMDVGCGFASWSKSALPSSLAVSNVVLYYCVR